MGLNARESKEKDRNLMPGNRIHGRALVNYVTDVTFIQKAQTILARQGSVELTIWTLFHKLAPSYYLLLGI
jgi:hypothetical protein